eukprot:COSAG04_NODE_3946_length_2405_cov_66.168690_1_plen_391_part_00
MVKTKAFAYSTNRRGANQRGRRKKPNPSNMKKARNFKQANKKGMKNQMMLRRQPLVETKQRVESDIAFMNGHNTEHDWTNPLAYRPISVANAFTLLPIECFTRQSQGFQEWNMIGSSITSKWLKTKIDFRFPFNNFVANENGAVIDPALPGYDPSKRSLNKIIENPCRLYMICGWVTNPTNFPVNPPDHSPGVPAIRADTATQQDLFQHIENELKPYFDDRSDKLSFRPKETTNIKIESYRRIKPNLNEAIASQATPDTVYTQAETPNISSTAVAHGSVPNVHRTHSYKCPGKITYTLGQPALPTDPALTPPQADTQNFYLNNNWLPFCMIYNPDYANQLEQYAGDKATSDCPVTSGPPGPEDCPLDKQYDGKVCWIEYRYNNAHYYTDS